MNSWNRFRLINTALAWWLCKCEMLMWLLKLRYLKERDEVITDKSAQTATNQKNSFCCQMALYNNHTRTYVCFVIVVWHYRTINYNKMFLNWRALRLLLKSSCDHSIPYLKINKKWAKKIILVVTRSVTLLKTTETSL